MSDDQAQGRHTTIRLESGRTVASWLVLLIVCVGQFMVVLDASIVNVALPSIQHDLHFSTSRPAVDRQCLHADLRRIPLAGRPGRPTSTAGARSSLVGWRVFTLSSLLGGLAQNEAWLIGARALQGIGAAILAPATLTILTATYPEGPARAWALGAWSAVSSAGASAGCAARWHPHGVPQLAVDPLRQRARGRRRTGRGADRHLPESRADMAHRHLDLAGAVTVTAGLVALVFSLVRTETYSWGSPQVLVPLALAVVLLAVFLFLQARVSKAPLVPLRIFRSRSVAGGNVVMLPALRRRCSPRGTSRRSTCSTSSAIQPAQAGPRLPAPDPPHRRRRAGDVAPGAAVRARPLILLGDRGGRAGWLGCRRSRRTAPSSPTCWGPSSSSAWAWAWRSRRSRWPGRRVCAARRPAWPRACSTRPARSVPPSAWPHWPPWPPAAPRVLKGTAATPAHTATALTDGYTLAFIVAAGVLVVTHRGGLGGPALSAPARSGEPSDAGGRAAAGAAAGAARARGGTRGHLIPVVKRRRRAPLPCR